MRKYFQARPWRLLSSARQLAELHTQVHGGRAPLEIPLLRQRLEERIEAAQAISESERDQARRCLNQMPNGDSLCHGDFHPDNILLTGRGAVIIDWGTGSRGDALADVATTSLLFEGAPLPLDVPAYLKVLVNMSRALLHQRYLQRYFQLRPGGRETMEQWRLFLRATMPGTQNTEKRSQDSARLQLALGRKETAGVQVSAALWK